MTAMRRARRRAYFGFDPTRRHFAFSIAFAPGASTLGIHSLRGGGRLELPVEHVEMLRAALATLDLRSK